MDASSGDNLSSSFRSEGRLYRKAMLLQLQEGRDVEPCSLLDRLFKRLLYKTQFYKRSCTCL